MEIKGFKKISKFIDNEALLKRVFLHNLNHVLVFCLIFTFIIAIGLSFNINTDYLNHATVLMIIYVFIVVFGILIQRFKHENISYYIILFTIFYTSTLISLLVSTYYSQASFELIFLLYVTLILMSGFILVSPIIHMIMLTIMNASSIYLIINAGANTIYLYILLIVTFSAIAQNHSKVRLLFEKYTSEITIRDMDDMLIHTSRKDVLTNLYNNAYVHEHLEHEIERCKRYKAPLSLIMIDIDNFKDINAHYGQVAGDEILSTIGNILLATSRSTDIVGRFSGKSFICILPNTSLDETIILAERLRITVNKNDFDIHTAVTVSIGLKAHSGETAKEYIEACLLNVEQAKASGKNTIHYE